MQSSYQKNFNDQSLKFKTHLRNHSNKDMDLERRSQKNLLESKMEAKIETMGKERHQLAKS